MAVSSVSICGSCRHLVVGTAGECPTCKQPLGPGCAGVPRPVPVRLAGRPPTPEELYALRQADFRRRPPSAEEGKKALRFLLVGLIAGPLVTLFGIWVVGNFRGPGVLFFGYLPALGGPFLLVVMVLMGLNLLLRDGRKKTPEKAFNWVWKEALFAEDSFSFTGDGRFEKPEYAYGALRRALPETLCLQFDKDMVLRYLSQLRGYVDNTLDEAAAQVDLTCLAKSGTEFSCTWGEGGVDVKTTIDSIEPLAEGLSRVQGSVTITKKLSSKISDNTTYNLAVSAVQLHVDGHYIQNGNHWFPCDVTPLFAEADPPPLRPAAVF